MNPNVTVYFNSVNRGVIMVVRVVATGEKRILKNGEATQFTLPAGSQTLIIKIGKKNYSRNVLVIPNQNVNIFCAFDGRGRITVENPNGGNTPQFAQAGFNGVPSAGVPVVGGYGAPMQAGIPMQDGYGAPMQADMPMQGGYAAAPSTAPVAGFAVKNAEEAKVPPFSAMAIVGFILSFFLVTSPLGVILGIVHLAVFGRKLRGNGLAIAGIVIGVGMSIMLFILIGEGAFG